MSNSLQITKGIPGRRQRALTPRPVPCQICGSETEPGLDLGIQPIGDDVRSPRQLNQPETLYPLQLHHCYTCGLTQLSYVVNPKIVYKNFPFVSGTTTTATRHLQTLPQQMVEIIGVSDDFFALDIGSNDGTLLKGYVPHGVRFLGVDPAGDPVRIANENGIPTLHAFFNYETAQVVRTEHGSVTALSACGVFAHIADLTGVMKGAKHILAPNGVFATDSQYWLDTMQRGHYDNVFHQHLRYYAMKPLIYLFNQYDMDVFDVERSEVYGGSIRVFSCHKGAYPISKRVTDLVALEEEQKLYDRATNVAFDKEITARKIRFFAEVYNRKQAGQKIIGIGAPAKASTVCNYCGVRADLVDYITEINPLRIGMHLPGVRIPIIDEEHMFTDDPQADAAILFAWNYYDEVVPKLRQKGFKGDIILP